MKEVYYDYKVGLETPYWIQEIRSLKGRVVWTFQTPVSVSFILVVLFSGISTFLLLKPLFPILYHVSFIPLAICIFLPWKMAKMYVEYEPDGKRLQAFLFDSFRFWREFVLDKRVIYNEERRKKLDQVIVFEQTKL